jgi:hypothetical protein
VCVCVRACGLVYGCTEGCVRQRKSTKDNDSSWTELLLDFILRFPEAHKLHPRLCRCRARYFHKFLCPYKRHDTILKYSVFKRTLQCSDTFTKIILCYCVRHIEYCSCFVTLPPGAAHSPKITELRDTEYSNVSYVVTQSYATETASSF